MPNLDRGQAADHGNSEVVDIIAADTYGYAQQRLLANRLKPGMFAFAL